MYPELERILIDREQIAQRVAELGREIAEDFAQRLNAEGEDPDSADRVVIVPIMAGAMVFTADLIRHLQLKLRLELLAVSSYPGSATRSKGAQLASELRSDLTGKHVLIVDDILDSGQTLRLVRDLLHERGAASIRAAVLLDKQGVDRVAPPEGHEFAEHVGFEIPDAFVVGYGLDYDGFYRNLPDIGVLRPQGEQV